MWQGFAMIQNLNITYEDDSLKAKATILGTQLNLPLNNEASNQLHLSHDKLSIIIPPFLPMAADFSWQTWQHRHQAGKKQALVRACKPKPGLRILDATAGWGRDAAVLASFGAEVLMLERNPVLAALLDDALQRRDALAHSHLNLKLLNLDALAYLKALTPEAYPDLIYLDPMHPERQKSALVKKDLQLLQQWLGPDDQVLTLITLARQRAHQKVVVKWPQKSRAIIPPTTSISGKTVRFDCYLPS